MNMNAIRPSAGSVDINPGKLTKVELIKRIQLAEGNFDCYASATSGECDQTNCSWRSDCLGEAKDAPVAAWS